jgi:uncharacterized membrane protein
LTRLAYLASCGSLIALVLLCLAWELWLAPMRPGGSWAVLKVLPLLLPLRGILAGRRHTYQWASLFIWLYFIEGAVRAWSDRPPAQYFAIAEVMLCLVFSAAAGWHARRTAGSR